MFCLGVGFDDLLQVSADQAAPCFLDVLASVWPRNVFSMFWRRCGPVKGMVPRHAFRDGFDDFPKVLARFGNPSWDQFGDGLDDFP